MWATVIFTLLGPAASVASQPPVNDSPPEVVGTPLVGERIVCGAGSWSGTVSEFRYRWLRDGTTIASGVAYKISTADAGHSLWCAVTAIGGGGSAEAESSNSLQVPGSRSEPPANTAPPEVTGTPAIGATLTCSPGAWTGTPTPSLTYQWIRDKGLQDESTVQSATGGTYKVQSEDSGYTLACKVTATNAAGSASKFSSNVVQVPGTAPEPKTAPRVLGIEPAAVGESLTCATGSWSGKPAPTFTYQWVRDRGLSGQATIESATSSTYVVEASDQLRTLSCTVTATNSAGSAQAPSTNAVSVRGSKPENVSPPTLTGSVVVGDSLTCHPGEWTGLPSPTFSFRWLRDQGTPKEVAIGSAASETYTVRSEDRGHSLSCAVTATNSEGSASRTSERVVVPAQVPGGSPPQNESAPTVSGEPALGATLTCSEGTWSGVPAPTLSYQWQRDGSPIVSATAATYVVSEGDQGRSLACMVTAVNTEGLASQLSSNSLEIPGVAPVNLEEPRVAGTAAVGQQLTCLRGTWKGQPPPAFSYQWLRDGAAIGSATASSYTVTSSDRGSAISCTVTGQNSAGSATALSSNSLSIPGGPPQNQSLPEVLGTAAVGQQLTCSPGAWTGNPPPTYTYQWLREGAEIAAQTGSAYTVATSDRGLGLSCKVTASNREGAETATSKSVHVPGLRPQMIEAPQVSGAAAVGAGLTCQRGTWGGAPPPAFTYRWLRDGALIAAATSITYTVELGDKGHSLSCAVTATNSEGRAEAESSNAVAIPRGSGNGGELAFTDQTLLTQPTSEQIVTSLRVQLARVQHRVRVATLRKAGLYGFPFSALAAGTLEYLWYQAPEAGHPLSGSKVVLAQAAMRFPAQEARTVKLRLTVAGRRLLARSSRIPIRVKATFSQTQTRPVIWLGSFLFSH